jgi:hypothetical protein
MSQTRTATPQPPISKRLTSLVWLVGGGFFPCLGINDGRLGLGGGLEPSRPLLAATLGESSVAEVMEGLSCEYDAVDPTVRLFGLRRACIFRKLLVAWLSILPTCLPRLQRLVFLGSCVLGPVLTRAAGVPMTVSTQKLGTLPVPAGRR